MHLSIFWRKTPGNPPLKPLDIHFNATYIRPVARAFNTFFRWVKNYINRGYYFVTRRLGENDVMLI